MNFFILFDDPKIDPFKNKYYKIKGYILDDTQKWKARELRADEPQLVRCPKKEIQKYFKNVASYYYN